MLLKPSTKSHLNMEIFTHFTFTPFTFAPFYSLLLLFTTSLTGTVGIRITDMKLPSVVKVGAMVELACHFDLEGANLYSLTWWRGADQFYQFSPSSAEPVIVYHASGINVDESGSEGEVVVLRNISHASSGKYKCEVLEDYPSFQKDSQVKLMQVVDEPKLPPRMSLIKHLWSPGEELNANCTSPSATPIPHLHWYINGIQIPPDHSVLLSEGGNGRGVGVAGTSGWRIQGESNEQLRTSHLSIVLEENHFSVAGKATLKCDATYKNVYHRWNEVEITTPWYKTAAPSQRLYGSAVTVVAGVWLALAPIIPLMLQ